MLTDRSLRAQITLLASGLILATVIALLAAYWVRTGDYTRQQIEHRMDSAQSVLEQYLLSREKLLVTAARVLTADFGFKQAVATLDTETINSVLLNHGERIDADLMVLTGLDGAILSASAGGHALAAPELAAAIGALPLRPQHSQLLRTEAGFYQVFALPVLAPRPIAYTVIGFRADRSALQELKRLTGMDITLLAPGGDPLATTFEPGVDMRRALAEAGSGEAAGLLGGASYVYRDFTLETLGNVRVLLSASLAEARAGFNRLLASIALIGGGILALSLLFSQVILRGITRPLHHLVGLTRQVAQGDFNLQASTAPAAAEFRELNQAFLRMGGEIERRENEIIYQAEHDLLTGALGRNTLLARLDDALHAGQTLLLLGVNILRFRQLNDAVGPDNADRVLQSLAGRLTHCAETLAGSDARCLVGRVGADHFLVAVPVPAAGSAGQWLHEVYAAINEPYVIGDLRLTLSLCLGYVEEAEAGVPARDLLRQVFIAAGAARNRPQRLRAYQRGEDEAYLRRLFLVERLKRALVRDDGALFLTYQPKLDLARGRIDRVEALVRWVDDEHGFISPDEFVPLAEQSGLIIKLTRWVVRSVLRQLALWNASGLHLGVAINVSAQDICHEQFIDSLLHELRESGVRHEQVTLEITERDLMDNEALAVEQLTALKAAGFRIAVDDYGVGYSSLSKLKQLPVDELKIDKSFILQLPESEQDQNIVSSTIELGHKLGLKVVAEGVETSAGLDLLRAMRCDSVQGYHLARPMSAEDLTQWYASYAQTA
ncbi:putative bifunctional diguanylate cyclase/phosphodiesterase [Mangrovimicrobium sediminis]|nr:EAL domain-containing protein [Haliea sp. SAOS-164]